MPPEGTGPSGGDARRRARILGVVVPIAFVSVFVVLAWVSAPGPAPWALDSAAATAAAAVQAPLVTPVMSALTWFGDAWVVAAITAAAAVGLWRRGHRRFAEVLVAIMLIDMVGTPLAKTLFARPRPSLDGALAGMPASASYPSGHAMAAALLYGFLALVLVAVLRTRRARILAALGLGALAVGVGVSRVYLGVHWPSDVLGAWCVAGAVLVATWVWVVGPGARHTRA